MWERHPTPPQKILLCLTTSSSFPFLFSFFIVFFLLPCSHSTLFLIPFLLYLSSSFFSTPFCLASISFSLSPPPPSVRLLLPTFYMSHNVLFLFLFYFLISFFFNFSFSFCSTPSPLPSVCFFPSSTYLITFFCLFFRPFILLIPIAQYIPISTTKYHRVMRRAH